MAFAKYSIAMGTHGIGNAPNATKRCTVMTSVLQWWVLRWWHLFPNRYGHVETEHSPKGISRYWNCFATIIRIILPNIFPKGRGNARIEFYTFSQYMMETVVAQHNILFWSCFGVDVVLHEKARTQQPLLTCSLSLYMQYIMYYTEYMLYTWWIRIDILPQIHSIICFTSFVSIDF